MNRSIFLLIVKDNKFLSLIDPDGGWILPGLKVENDEIDAIFAEDALEELLDIDIEQSLLSLYSGLFLNKTDLSKSSWATTFMYDASDDDVILESAVWRPMSDLGKADPLFKEYYRKIHENYYLSKNPIFATPEMTL